MPEARPDSEPGSPPLAQAGARAAADSESRRRRRLQICRTSQEVTQPHHYASGPSRSESDFYSSRLVLVCHSVSCRYSVMSDESESTFFIGAGPRPSRHDHANRIGLLRLSPARLAVQTGQSESVSRSVAQA